MFQNIPEYGANVCPVLLDRETSFEDIIATTLQTDEYEFSKQIGVVATVGNYSPCFKFHGLWR